MWWVDPLINFLSVVTTGGIVYGLSRPKKETIKDKGNKNSGSPYRELANANNGETNDKEIDKDHDEHGHLRWKGRNNFVCSACGATDLSAPSFCQGGKKCPWHPEKIDYSHIHAKCHCCGAHHLFGEMYNDSFYKSKRTNGIDEIDDLDEVDFDREDVTYKYGLGGGVIKK